MPTTRGTRRKCRTWRTMREARTAARWTRWTSIGMVSSALLSKLLQDGSLMASHQEFLGVGDGQQVSFVLDQHGGGGGDLARQL